MRIYRGTMQIHQFQFHRDSPCATLAMLDSPQGGSPASVCIWRHRKEIFLWDGEQSSREKSDHTAKPIWSLALSKVMITSPSLAALPFCPPVHPHTRACSLWHSQQCSVTGLVFGWDCKTREVDCHPWLYDLFRFPFNPCFSQHG